MINDAHVRVRTGSVIIGSPPLGYRHTLRPIVAPRHCTVTGTYGETNRRKIRRMEKRDQKGINEI